MAKKLVDDKLAQDAFIKARAGLVLDQPFFGALALRLTPTIDRSVKTAWTDGKSLGFNPEWFTGLSIPKRKGLIGHEIMHCALAHTTRRGSRKPRKWNKACDYVINAILIDSGFDLPEEGLIDPQYKNWSSEKVYDSLPDEPDGPDGPNDGSNNDPGGNGEVRDGGADASELEQQEQEWKQATVQAAQAAKMCGNMPGFAEQLIGDMLRPKIDWRDVLSAFLDPTARDDYSWAKRSRRFQDIYLPTMRSEQVGEVVVVRDTSGSVSDTELKMFMGELMSILHHVKPKKVHVLDVDTRVCAVHEVEPHDYDESKLLKHEGRGGTDFKPAFDWVAKMEMTPECLIYFSDMECNSYAKEPEYETFWVSTRRPAKAPYGQLFFLEDMK